MRVALGLCIVLSLFITPCLANELDGMHETRVKQLLVKPVHLVSKDVWHKIGVSEATNEVLISFVLDRDMREVYRLRSIQALAYFPGRKSHQFLWQVVHDRVMDDRYKLAALSTLGAGYQAEALMELSPFLREKSAFLREGAIRGLGFIRDPRVLPILRNHLHQESDLELRLLVEQSIEQVERAEAEDQKAREVKLLEQSNRALKLNSLGEGEGEGK